MVLMDKLEEKIVPKTLFELLKGQLEISNCDFMDRKITGIQLDSRLVDTITITIRGFDAGTMPTNNELWRFSS